MDDLVSSHQGTLDYFHVHDHAMLLLSKFFSFKSNIPPSPVVIGFRQLNVPISPKVPKNLLLYIAPIPHAVSSIK